MRADHRGGHPGVEHSILTSTVSIAVHNHACRERYSCGDVDGDSMFPCTCLVRVRSRSVYVYGLSINSTTAFSGYMASFHACSPIFDCAYSTVFATACLALMRSISSRRCSYLTILPSTITVCTSPRPA